MLALRMRFTGRVECRRTSGAATLTLIGLDAAGDRVHLSLLGDVPADLPGRLDAASVDCVEAQRFRIVADGRSWTVAAPRAYLHHDLSEVFYRAVPPRAVPLAKRLFWRIVLSAAASRFGRRWLAR